jgi:hypothetical protein
VRGISDIRIRIQCENDIDHAKILPIASFMNQAPTIANIAEADRSVKLYFAKRIGEIICGGSDMYIYQPSNRSPIGKCALCGGRLHYEIQELDTPQEAPAPAPAHTTRTTPRRKRAR